MREFGAKGTNHSAAICLALEIAAETMQDNKERLQERYAAFIQGDGRRRGA